MWSPPGSTIYGTGNILPKLFKSEEGETKIEEEKTSRGIRTLHLSSIREVAAIKL